MASSDNKSFLLLNNEIHNDTFLFGFELYGSQSGYLNVKVNIMKISIATLEFIKINFLNKIVSSDACGLTKPCAIFFTQNPFNISMNTIYNWDFAVTTGRNQILLPAPMPVYKGNFVYLTQNSGKLAIDSSNAATYSDLSWQSTIWLPLKENLNWRFYLNAITNFTSYETNFRIVRPYKSIGLYNLSINFLSSNQSFTQTVNITDCNYFFILCILCF